MAKPWEKYAANNKTTAAKPWEKYSASEAPAEEKTSPIYDAVENSGEVIAKLVGKGLHAAKIPQALDYVGGVTRTGLGAAVLPNTTSKDFKNALKGEPLSTKEMAMREGVKEGSKLSDVVPSMYNQTGKGIKLQKGGWADPSALGAAGFVGDVATDPLTYGSLGIAPAAKYATKALAGSKYGGNLASKLLSVVPKVTNPATEGLKPLGKTMYKSGFKPIDAVSAKYNKIPASEIAWKYGMTGTNKNIAKQADEVLTKLGKKKSDILERVDAAGIKPDLDAAFSKADNYASQLEASRNADRIDAAQALRSEAKRYKDPLLPKDELGAASIKDLESVKQSMYGGLPQSAYKSGTQSASDLGKVAQKQMSRGVKEEIENTVAKLDPKLKPEFTGLNDEMGGLLSTAAAFDKEALKGTNKNLLTSVDPMLVSGVKAASGSMGDGVWALVAKKLADLSKTTAGRTTAGRAIYNLGDIPGMDAFLRRPNPWQGLYEDKPQGEE